MTDKHERNYLSPRMKEMQRRIDSASPNRTGVASKSYRDNWASIFKKPKKK